MGTGDLTDTVASGVDIMKLMYEACATEVVLPPTTDSKKWLELAAVGSAKMKEITFAEDPGAEARAAMKDESLLTCLAAAYRYDEATMNFYLQSISVAPKCSKVAASLRSAIKIAAKQQALQLERDSERERKHKRKTPLRKMFNVSLIPEGLRCPDGYEITEDGIFRIITTKSGDERLIKTCTAPIFVVKRYLDVRTGEVEVLLIWRQGGRWSTKMWPRKNIYESKGITSLSEWDAPIMSANANDAMRYLAEFEAANIDVIPTESVTSSMGWQDDKMGGFLVGDTMIQDAGSDAKISLRVQDGFGTFCDGWKTSGDLNSWYAVAENVEWYPAPFAAIYASIASILLPICEVPNFVMEWAGETTGGKTTTLRVGASVWGCPSEVGGILTSWNQTRVSFEETAAFSGNLPLYCDDTAKLAKKDPEFLSSLIYDHSAGQGRARAKSDGGLRIRKGWRSILMSTGETPAHMMTNNAGARARILSFVGYPFGRATDQADLAQKKDTIARIEKIMSKNYGLFGPHIVSALVNVKDPASWVRGTYDHYLAKYRAQADNGVLSRMSPYVAILNTAADLCHHCGLPNPKVDVMDAVWDSARKTSLEADVGIAALLAFFDFCVQSEARFWGRHNESRDGNVIAPTGGWLGAWEKRTITSNPNIYIMPSILNEFLRTRNYHPSAILDIWAERGYIARATDGRRIETEHVEIGGSSRPCIKFRSDLLKQSDVKE